MIRKYQSDDVESILAVWEAASAIAHPFLSDDFMASERLNIRDIYLPNTETWVWEVEGGVVGFVSMIESEVGALFVHPEYHGQGIGRSLVDHVGTTRDSLEVEVFKENRIGREFYDRYGFVFREEKLHEPTGHVLLRLGLNPVADA